MRTMHCLCILVRINRIGPVAVKAFYDAVYKSVSDVACADAVSMLEKVPDINKIKQYYKANKGSKKCCFALILRIL